MTRKEYARYVKSFGAFFKREGVKVMSVKDPEASPYFSWLNCECCGRSQGGDRYEMSVVFENGKDTDITYAICPDCYYFNEYGQLDDMTMMDLMDEPEPVEDDWGTQPARLRT